MKFLVCEIRYYKILKEEIIYLTDSNVNYNILKFFNNCYELEKLYLITFQNQTIKLLNYNE